MKKFSLYAYFYSLCFALFLFMGTAHAVNEELGEGAPLVNPVEGGAPIRQYMDNDERTHNTTCADCCNECFECCKAWVGCCKASATCCSVYSRECALTCYMANNEAECCCCVFTPRQIFIVPVEHGE